MLCRDHRLHSLPALDRPGRRPRASVARAVLVLAGLVAGCADYDTVVVGRNDPAVDVAAVQAAVDEGGRVLLRGSFDFGVAQGEPYDLVPNPPANWSLPSGPTHVPATGSLESSRRPSFWADPPRTVFVTRDVEIHGDDSARIVGGYRSFTLGYRPPPGRGFVYDPNVDDGHLETSRESLSGYPIRPVRVTISGLHFAGSLHSSIWLAATEGETRIVDNRFTDLQPQTERYWFGSSRAIGIYTQGGVAALSFPNYLDPKVSDMREVLLRSDGVDSRTGSAVQGDLIVRDNVLETDRGGLIYALYLGGDVTVEGNTARGGGIGIFGYFGRTVIRQNHLDAGRPVRNLLRVSEDSFGRHHPLTEPAGRSWAEGDWDQASTVLAENTLVSGGTTPLEVLLSRNVVVEKNQVTAARAPGLWSDGIYLWRVHDSSVRGNLVDGSALFGVDLAESNGNVIEENDFGRFTPEKLSPSLPAAHLALLFGSVGNAVHGVGSGPDAVYVLVATDGNDLTRAGSTFGPLDEAQQGALAQVLRSLPRELEE